MTSLPSSVSPAPHSVVSSANSLEVHETPVPMSVTEMLKVPIPTPEEEERKFLDFKD